MNKASESYKVYLEKSEPAEGGVHSSQPEGRKSLPASQKVREAEVEKGAALRCARKQVGDNRLPMNSHIQEKKEFGPNN